MTNDYNVSNDIQSMMREAWRQYRLQHRDRINEQNRERRRKRKEANNGQKVISETMDNGQ